VVLVAHNPLDGSECGVVVRRCHVSLRDSVVINRGELVVLLINGYVINGSVTVIAFPKGVSRCW
jgi:hypothetical protein